MLRNTAIWILIYQPRDTWHRLLGVYTNEEAAKEAARLHYDDPTITHHPGQKAACWDMDMDVEGWQLGEDMRLEAGDYAIWEITERDLKHSAV